MQIVDFVCSETYPIKSNNLFEFLATLIGRIVQTDKSTEDFPMLVAKHLSTLHKATNRLCLHLLNRLQFSAERLLMFVDLLAEASPLVFGPYNNEAPMLLLIGHALFQFFFHDNVHIRRSAMRIWSLLLETKRAVMLGLLAYKDNAGSVRSLFYDGFDKLLTSGSGVQQGTEKSAAGKPSQEAMEAAVTRFHDWLWGAGKGKNDQSSRMGMIASLVNDNGAKQRALVRCSACSFAFCINPSAWAYWSIECVR
eukprot:1585921-Rhodomonas_salina.2